MQPLPENRYKIDKWWLVQEIKYELFSTDPRDTEIDFRLREQKGDAPSKDIQTKLMKQLAFTDSIKIISNESELYRIEVLPKFNKTYDSLYFWFKDFQIIENHRSKVSEQKPLDETIDIKLVKDGRNLTIEGDGKKVLIRRLTIGLPPDLVMGYLINNRTNTIVHLPELKRELDGMASVPDISELIRGIGFDRKLKDIFFKHLGATTVELRNPARVSRRDWQHIVTFFDSDKTVKNRKK